MKPYLIILLVIKESNTDRLILLDERTNGLGDAQTLLFVGSAHAAQLDATALNQLDHAPHPLGKAMEKVMSNFHQI